MKKTEATSTAYTPSVRARGGDAVKKIEDYEIVWSCRFSPVQLVARNWLSAYGSGRASNFSPHSKR